MRSLILIVLISISLASCSDKQTYSVGVYNNTSHSQIKLKIQYPSPDGMKRISFSMIDVGGFKANDLDTKNNPVPKEAKISWKNSNGNKRQSVIDLSHLSMVEGESAIMFHIDEDEATVEYFNSEQFAGEWDRRLERKAYK
ncbi:hypothetical protein A9Q82_05910 [Cycloclasticus sp. 46_120_T64]|nr:hypothetical protein A9Q82_05910 [Cycloclasticus sp. 46_120_T64]